MTPRWIVPIVAALALGISVSAQAATIEISMENLEISPAEASAKVGDTIGWSTRTSSPTPRPRKTAIST